MELEVKEIDAPGGGSGAIDWENRRLCSDGNCIGVIGADGRCKECGSASDLPRLIAELIALLPAPTVHRVVIEGERPLSWNHLYKSTNHHERSELARRYHTIAKYAVMEQLEGVQVEKAAITMIGYGKGQIADCSNLCLKVYEDGLVEAGLIPDDSPKHVEEVRLVSKKDNEHPRVEILREERN